MMSGYFNLGTLEVPGGTIPEDIEQRINDYSRYRLNKPIVFTIKSPLGYQLPCVVPIPDIIFADDKPSEITFNLSTGVTLSIDMQNHSYRITIE